MREHSVDLSDHHSDQKYCIYVQLQSRIFTTGIWNLPIIRANPIVGVEAEWPITACVVSDFVQLPSYILALWPFAKSMADFMMFDIPQAL